MKKVIDELLIEATILGMIDEARPRGNPKALARAKRAAANQASKSGAGQEAEKLGLVWKGGRAYGKTADGPTLATSIKGKLVFTDEETEKKLKGGELKNQPDDKNTARDDQSADGSDLDVFSDDPKGDEKKDKDKDKDKDIVNKINSSKTTKQANEILRKKQPKLSPEEAQKAENKDEFLTSMVDAILVDPRQEAGAGRFRMSREDLSKYQAYLEGEKPEVPQYKVSDEELDKVMGNISARLGKDEFKRFIAKMARKGDPPKGMANVARSRAVVQDYIEKGGISAITGDHVPFFESQLDHRVSLDNGGVDGGENWDWMEARFNQFKGALTDEKVMQNIQKKLSRSEEEDRLEILQGEYKNMMKKSYIEYFKQNGTGSVSREDIEEASGEAGTAYLKSMAVATKTSYYAEAEVRASGRAGGGKYIGNNALKEKLLEKVSPLTRKEQKSIDEDFTKLTNELKGREEEIGQLKTTIKKQKSAKKESVSYDDIQTLIEMASKV